MRRLPRAGAAAVLPHTPTSHRLRQLARITRSGWPRRAAKGPRDQSGFAGLPASRQAKVRTVAVFAGAPLTSTAGRDIPWSMDVQAHEDVAATAAAHSELGHE